MENMEKLNSKFVACVSLYNPSQENIKQLNDYVKSFDIVIAYDNSEDNSQYRKKISDGILYIGNGVNDGLCICFNYAIEYCIKNEIDYLCTLDQDSIFKYEDIKTIKNSIVNGKYNNFGIVAPSIVYNHNPKYSNELKKVSWTICSGSFLNIDVLKKENIRYDEYYFLDRFDKDICEQVIRKGYSIYIDSESKLYQELGYSIAGKSNHSPMRHYYIFRNRFYYNDKYYNKTYGNFRSLLQILRHIYGILKKEDKKIEKISQLKSGYLDYKEFKNGRK